MYVQALVKCLESVSYRVKTCEYIAVGDEKAAGESLLKVKHMTAEFKQLENAALDELERGLSRVSREARR
jgi:hypothetical protein